MTNHTNTYSLETIWEGNRGEGTKTYAGYGRGHRLVVSGKPDIPLTADLAFRGDPGVHNPDPGVPNAPILSFTMRRSWRSQWPEIRR